MLENDDVFTFRAPRFLKEVCNALNFNYGQFCREALIEKLTIRAEESLAGRGPYRKIKEDVFDEIDFRMNYSKNKQFVLFSAIKELQDKGVTLPEERKTEQLYKNVIHSRNTEPYSSEVRQERKTFDLGILRELVHVLMEEGEILECYQLLDQGEDRREESIKLITDYWMTIRDRGAHDHKDHIISATDRNVPETLRYIDSIDLPIPITELLSSVLLDMGETIADQRCEQEEAEA